VENIDPNSFDFEVALIELTALVEQMERGNLKLDESLQLFERGIKLSRACQTALQSAEQRVQIIIEKSVEAELMPYTPEKDET
jgi:exodeoxyribonuclease VII small subunit